MNICLLNNCNSPVKAKGLCNKHLRRQSKGIPLNEKSMFEKLAYERFWSQVEIKGIDDCWLWTGSTRGNNEIMYGSFWIGGKFMSAHRYSWMIENGVFPAGGDSRGMCVCHKCDNPLCVNPKHLFIGTHTDNMQDKINKGRCGQKNKTHCPQGHEYTEINTYICKQGLRHCRTCHRERERNRRQQQKQLNAVGG